jgi:hypothetical protein
MNWKMGDLSDFERGQIVGARLAGACDKTATLLGVSRATDSKVMSAYTNHGKTTSANRNSLGKINIDRFFLLWKKIIINTKKA